MAMGIYSALIIQEEVYIHTSDFVYRHTVGNKEKRFVKLSLKVHINCLRKLI